MPIDTVFKYQFITCHLKGGQHRFMFNLYMAKRIVLYHKSGIRVAYVFTKYKTRKYVSCF